MRFGLPPTRTLPLGIDIGTTRIRIAETYRDEGCTKLKRVIVIDPTQGIAHPEDETYLGNRIGVTLREFDVRERRCILAVGEPDATLRTVTFPPMSSSERKRAGRFEALRYIEYPLDEAFVRSVRLASGNGVYTLGIVRQAALQRSLRIARTAGLKPSVLDHQAYALQRAFPYADAILDIGHMKARLYAFGNSTPIGVAFDGGGDMFTQAIARGLSIDTPNAEHRKRSIGLSGAGEAELHIFTSRVGRALLDARNQGGAEIQRLMVTGNGARLQGITERLERDTGCSVDIASHLGIERSAYPIDITRASAPDWALSVGLALWSAEEQTT